MSDRARGRWFTRKCPSCGKRTVRTMESRPTQQWRRRRKHCLNCGATGATIEVVVEPGIKAMVSEVRARGGFQTMVRDMPMVLVAEKLSRRKAS